jgi:uncharacterized protein (DUF1778 family)
MMSGSSDDAAFYQKHKDDAEEWGEPEISETAERLSVVISVRLTPEQEDRVRALASRKGVTVSTLLREAALREARSVDTSGALSMTTLAVSSSTVTIAGVDMTISANHASSAA